MNLPKPIVMKGYAIYDPATDKWSRGGNYTSRLWGKKPKIWSAVGHVKNHINQLIVDNYDFKNKVIRIRSFYKGCVILDVTTMQPATDIDIYAYAREFAERELKHRESYNTGWKIVED